MIRVVFLMCPTETMTNVHMHAVKANTIAIRLVQSSVVVITTFHSVGTLSGSEFVYRCDRPHLQDWQFGLTVS
jgi:hypothetical protein